MDQTYSVTRRIDLNANSITSFQADSISTAGFHSSIVCVDNSFEINVIKNFLAIHNSTVEDKLMENRELSEFIYKSLLTIQAENKYWLGELDFIKDIDYPNGKISFVFRVQNNNLKSNISLIEYKKNKNDILYSTLLNSLTKGSKGLRNSIIIDERVL